MRLICKLVAVLLLAGLLAGCSAQQFPTQTTSTHTTAPDAAQQTTEPPVISPVTTNPVVPVPSVPTQPNGGTTEPDQPTESVTQPTEQPTRPEESLPTQAADPDQLSYQQYISMSAEAQEAYYKTFPDMLSFINWYNAAKEAYEQENPDIVVGTGPVDVGSIAGK